MGRRQGPGIKVDVQRRVAVENGHADDGLGAIAECLSQEVRQPESRHHIHEAHLRDAETMGQSCELLFVVRRGEDVAGALVRQESHQQVEVGRRGPACVAENFRAVFET